MRFFKVGLLNSLLLVGACLLTLTGCQPDSATPTLTIGAAASLKNAFEALQADFEQDHDIKLEFTFAASGLLRLQIEQGAPFDLYASANSNDMQRLLAAQKITPALDFAHNRLVLVSAQKRDCSWSTIAKQRLAIGNPETVPAGIYARESLSKLGLWTSLQSQVVYTEHVRQVVTYLQQGAVDYGIVYQSDLTAFPELFRCQVFAEDLHRPIVLSMARVLRGSRPEMAEAWLTYLQQDKARTLLKQAGFQTP